MDNNKNTQAIIKVLSVVLLAMLVITVLNIAWAIIKSSLAFIVTAGVLVLVGMGVAWVINEIRNHG